ncbi:MAG: hypothetical protein F4Y68_03500 [Boseongicola sp. SB0665_bin_10]|nr:hypothetical protein [Boseongicola sp. SB0665_bin_10]
MSPQLPSFPFVLSFLLAIPGLSFAGPLTEILLKSVEGHGEISWRSGVEEGGREILEGVTLDLARLPVPLRLDRLELSHAEGSLVMEGSGARMTTDTSRLSAPGFRFQGGPGLLQAAWSGFGDLDYCRFHGSKHALALESPEIVTHGLQLRVSGDAELTVSFDGTADSCAFRTSLSQGAWEAVHADGSGTAGESVDLILSLPGSLASVSRTPERQISVTVGLVGLTRRSPEGTRFLSVESGSLGWSMPSGALVVPLTAFLGAPASLEAAWNMLKGIRGKGFAAISGVTLRSAHVVPPAHVLGFRKAGLGTILLDSGLETELAFGQVMLDGHLAVSGLGEATLDAELRLGTWSSSPELSWLRHLPPVHVDRLLYVQTDKGFVAAASSIMGMPLTVRLERMRAWARTERPELAGVVDDLTAMAAEFAVRSLSDPPAVLTMSVTRDVNLRQAARLLAAFPEEVMGFLAVGLVE